MNTRMLWITVVSAAILGPAHAVLSSGGLAAQKPANTGTEAATPPLRLAAEPNAWVLGVTRTTGVGLVTATTAVSSTGEVVCEGDARGCNRSGYELVAEAVQAVLKPDARAALTIDESPLPSLRQDKLSFCMDCPLTTLTLYRREDGAERLIALYRWRTDSASALPDGIQRIHAALQSISESKQ